MSAVANERQVAALLPLLRDALGGVQVRRMDGAIGLYLQNMLFGLIQDGVLLFRVDASTRGAYDADEALSDEDGEDGEDGTEDGGSLFFDPPGGGAMTSAGFRRVPPFVLDDEDTLADWGKAAWEAAKHARAAAMIP